MTTFINRFLVGLYLLISLSISACASGPKVVDHAFGFDALADSPESEVVYYRYGDTSDPFVSADYAIRQFGRSMQTTNINGPIPLGNTLYVKWRIKSTGTEYEETVDLKSRLPANMHRQRVYFVVQGHQLLVYLTDLTKPKPPNQPTVGPFKAQSYLTLQIHPTPSRK